MKRTPWAVLATGAVALTLGGWAQAQTQSQPQAPSQSSKWGQPGGTGWNQPGSNHINQQPNAYNTASNGTPYQSSAGSSAGQSASSDRNTAGAGNLSAADKSFVTKAAQGGLAEVKLGELAQQNASDDAVKQFGKRMVDDHSKANDQLKSLAEQKSVTLPTDLDAKDKATYDRLSAMKGESFDRAYMRDMVKDHTKDVAEFRKESKTAKDSDLKNFASQTLPTLEEHLKLAKSTDQQVSKANASSAAKKKTGTE